AAPEEASPVNGPHVRPHVGANYCQAAPWWWALWARAHAITSARRYRTSRTPSRDQAGPVPARRYRRTVSTPTPRRAAVSRSLSQRSGSIRSGSISVIGHLLSVVVY